jgi:hypothetical protein
MDTANKDHCEKELARLQAEKVELLDEFMICTDTSRAKRIMASLQFIENYIEIYTDKLKGTK